jgi:hypothetical protein
VLTMSHRVEGPADLVAPVDGADALVLVADWPPYDLARWVNEACLARGVPFIAAGQLPPLLKIGPTYMPGRGACLACHERHVRRDFPLYDELAECRRRDPPSATTLGPASGAIGTLLALEVMHLLAGSEPPRRTTGRCCSTCARSTHAGKPSSAIGPAPHAATCSPSRAQFAKTVSRRPSRVARRSKDLP